MLNHLREWLREPHPQLPSEFTWGAIALLFLASILIIALALLG